MLEIGEYNVLESIYLMQRSGNVRGTMYVRYHSGGSMKLNANTV
jgi:hypothetical protein